MTAPATNARPVPPGRPRTHFLFEEFDALPRLMRDLINYAPVNVGTGYVVRQLAAGQRLEDVARAAIKRWRRYSRFDALAHYGPTHPQVASHDA